MNSCFINNKIKKVSIRIGSTLPCIKNEFIFPLPDCAYCLGFAEVERYGCPTELTVFVVGMPGLVGSCVMLAVPFVIDDVTPHTVVTTDKEGCC